MYLLSIIVLSFFTIIGLCAFITALLDIIYKGGSDAELILKDLEPDNAEQRIRSAARICMHHRKIRLICQCADSNPAYDICRMMQTEYPYLEIMSTDSNTL